MSTRLPTTITRDTWTRTHLVDNQGATLHLARPERFLETRIGHVRTQAVLNGLRQWMPLEPSSEYALLTVVLAEGQSAPSAIWPFGLRAPVWSPWHDVRTTRPEEADIFPVLLAEYVEVATGRRTAVILIGLIIHHPGTQQLTLVPFASMYFTALGNSLRANDLETTVPYMHFYACYIARGYMDLMVKGEFDFPAFQQLLSIALGLEPAATPEHRERAWQALAYGWRMNLAVTRTLATIQYSLQWLQRAGKND